MTARRRETVPGRSGRDRRRYTLYEMPGARRWWRTRPQLAVLLVALAVVAVGGGLAVAAWVDGLSPGEGAASELEAVAASRRAPPGVAVSGAETSESGSRPAAGGGGAGAAGGDVGGGSSSAVLPGVVPAAFAPINTAYAGLSMFRGNAHRAYYGTGPVPVAPRILWRFPDGGPMAASSSEGGESRIWAGTGWTGQPVVVEGGGRPLVMFGAYDRAVHFLDGDTGERVLPDLSTGDIIKGSVMVDPDGYPLLYTGSRDNYYRVVATDRHQPAVLWKLDAADVPNPVWNNDWDGSGVVIGDYLFEGGENSYFFIIRLNRGYDQAGKVTVAPRVVLAYPAYDQALFDAIGDRRVSIEDSPAVHLDAERGDRVYFANGGGRILGLDIGALGLSEAGYGPAGQAPGTWEDGMASPGDKGFPVRLSAGGVSAVGTAAAKLPVLPSRPEFPVAFKYWTGDDVDATIVIDEQGMLYVGVEMERRLPRAKEVGQLIKLDPYRRGDPLVWSVADPPSGGTSGIWATPALHGDMVYVPTHTGRLLGVDRGTGAIRWEKPFTHHAWSSPVVVDDTLIVGDTSGWLHAYDVTVPGADPPELWKVQTQGGGAVESTPAVWGGRVYVGSRDGYFYCFGDG